MDHEVRARYEALNGRHPMAAGDDAYADDADMEADGAAADVPEGATVYTVPYERMLVMPSNFITPNSDELNVLLLRAAPVLAQRIVAEVLAGKECHSTPSVGDRAIRWACTAEKHGSRLFGKHLHASNACTNCGWCARNCPRGNITMVDGKPTFDRHCVLCLRCVYGCPTHAIHAGLGGFAVFKDGFDLDALERRTATLTELPSIQVLTQGMMYKGVRVYLQEAAQE